MDMSGSEFPHAGLWANDDTWREITVDEDEREQSSPSTGSFIDFDLFPLQELSFTLRLCCQNVSSKRAKTFVF